jgi:hypothetical protein
MVAMAPGTPFARSAAPSSGPWRYRGLLRLPTFAPMTRSPSPIRRSRRSASCRVRDAWRPPRPGRLRPFCRPRASAAKTAARSGTRTISNVRTFQQLLRRNRNVAGIAKVLDDRKDGFRLNQVPCSIGAREPVTDGRSPMTFKSPPLWICRHDPADGITQRPRSVSFAHQMRYVEAASACGLISMGLFNL